MCSSDHRAAIRAQRVQARTDQILDAATRVFARKGFYHATTREIAAEAGVAEGTLYNYFENKNALLVAMIEHLAEIETLTRSLEASDDPPEVFLRNLLRHRFELFQRNAEVVHAVLPELLSQVELRQRFLGHMLQPTMAALYGYIERQVAQGRLRPLDPAMIVRLVQALFLGFAAIELSGEPVITRPDPHLPDLLADILLHGLLAGDE